MSLCHRLASSVTTVLVSLVAVGALLAAEPLATKVTNPPVERLESVLDQRVDIAFTERPFSEVCESLRQQTGVVFYLRGKKLEEAGINLDTPITSHFPAIRLRSWLDLMLDDLELTWHTKDDMIVITTREDSETRLLTRVYDCRDLLALPPATGPKLDAPTPPQHAPPAPAPGASAADASAERGTFCGSVRRAPRRQADPAEHLMEIVVQAVDLQTWDENGGPGTIGEYRGMLVVSQTEGVHRKIEHVLGMLREAVGLEMGGVKKVVR